MTAQSVRPASRRALWDIVWLLALGAYVLAGTAVVPFHPDEATQIAMSADYADAVGNVAYSAEPARPDLQELRLINGSISKYTIGLSWDLASFTADDLNQPWDWGADWDYNVSTGHMPDDALLLAARWPSALFTAASVVLIFVLGRLLDARLVAYLASAYYALHPVVLLNGRRAMMEGGLLLFGLLVVVCAVMLLRRRSWGWALALGVAGGLAVAAKHTNVFVVAPVFAACALAPLVWRTTRHPNASGVAFYWRLAVAAVVVVLVFFTLNPVWWGADPVALGRLVLELRASLLAGQTAAYGGYDGLLDQLGGFGRQALTGLRQYFEDPRFAGWLAEPIARYEASVWRGVSLGGSAVGALILLALAALGGWRLVRDAALRAGDRWVVGAWALAALALTCLLTPLEWQRYYVPVLPVLGLLAALGAAQVIRTFHRA